MGGFSLMHWLVLGVVAILLLGGGRFSNMMGDVAKGIKSFKKGMADDDDKAAPARIEAKKAAEPAYEAEVEKVREER
jgi:sec-independent protein translocase protein TatA